MNQEAFNVWNSLSAFRMAVSLSPFILLLACIALFPIVPVLSKWWDKDRNKFIVSASMAVAGILLFALPTGDWHKVGYAYLEYLAFLALLGSLFIISGGIHISGAFAGFPHVNTIFLALGALLANVLGTTGASMLLIRPLLRANRHRQHKAHIVIFFIFIIGNCGGLLTPLGDPPLYLGFLAGVPFAWNLGLFKAWAFVNFSLLFIFHIIDEYFFVREKLSTKRDIIDQTASSGKKVKVRGWRNLGLLVGVTACVVFSARLDREVSMVFQIAALGGLAAWSWFRTPKSVHVDNHFSMHPMAEVAALFFGIFGAMLPVLAILESSAGSIPMHKPVHYFWGTGALSGFLDNAPTYLTFAGLAAVKAGLKAGELGALAARAPEYLAAVSYGAVFMGAMTYVGNGPNFMVKNIAEHSKIKMPSFGGYLLWSLAVMAPLMFVFSLVFF